MGACGKEVIPFNGVSGREIVGLELAGFQSGSPPNYSIGSSSLGIVSNVPV